MQQSTLQPQLLQEVEDKLWLQAQIDKQIKSAALAPIDLNPVTVEWIDEDWIEREWTQLSLQGLSRAYGDDEPDYEILETRSKLEISKRNPE